MEGWEEERGRRSPGADRPLRDNTQEPVHCNTCQRPLDQRQKISKLFGCKHVVCLKCTTSELNESHEMLCWDCSRRADLPAQVAPVDQTPGHDPPPPAGPASWHGAPPGFNDALHSHAAIARTTQLLRADLCHFAARQREFLLRALDAAIALKMRLEAELAVSAPIEPPAPALSPLDMGALPAAIAKMEHLHLQRNSALLQCRLDDLVGSTGALLDYELMRRALLGLGQPEARRSPSETADVDPVLFLANYCAAQLYTRSCLQQLDESDPGAPPLLRMPPSYPLYYFNLEINGLAFGRFVIEVRNDLAPRMARNFSILTTGELGIGYRGCTIFQCWERESVITGDFELNNGRGGRSVFERGFFMPDDTKIAPVRGTVGMRRTQKRRNHLGLVGSQFRIILREMRGFTAIFGFVVEGLELVEQLSCTGDSAGKPHSTILISNCGRLN